MAGSTKGYEIDQDLRSRSQSPLFWGVKLLNAVLMAQKKKKKKDMYLFLLNFYNKPIQTSLTLVRIMALAELFVLLPCYC